MYNSARATFYAPSDLSGIGGMHHERIRATRSWYGGSPRYDCVFLGRGTEEVGFSGLHAAHVLLFFGFNMEVTIILVLCYIGFQPSGICLILRLVCGSLNLTLIAVELPCRLLFTLIAFWSCSSHWSVW